MRHRLLTLTVSLGLVLGLFIAAPIASVSGAVPCPTGGTYVGSGTVVAVIYESHDYNAGQTANFRGALCIRAPSSGGTLIPNLGNVNYVDGSQADVCDGQLLTSYGSWNDCAGSYKVSIGCHHKVYFYNGANYANLMWTVLPPGQNRATMLPGWDNTMSSIRVTYSALCATSV